MASSELELMTEEQYVEEEPKLRRRKMQKPWMTKVINDLAKYPNISAVCAKNKVPLPTYYHWRKRDPKFKLAVEEAISVGIAELEKVAWSRATGEDGRPPSDLMMMFLLKAHRPDMYRELSKKVEYGTVDGKPLQIQITAVDYRNAVSSLKPSEEVALLDSPAVITIETTEEFEDGDFEEVDE